MRTTAKVTDDELDAALRNLDSDSSFQIDQDRLARVAATSAPAVIPRRKLRASALWAATAVAAALGLGLAAPALADGIQQLAQTGRYGPVTSESDASEWINSSGSDFYDYAESLYPEVLPLPDGVSVDTFKDESILQLAAIEGESQDVTLVSSFEHNARCVWVDEWLLADAAKDQMRADGAATVLAESTTWPATVAIAGGGFLEHLVDVAEAAATGDRAALVDQKGSDCGSMPEGLRR
jgi:hypothetical protein